MNIVSEPVTDLADDVAVDDQIRWGIDDFTGDVALTDEGVAKWKVHVLIGSDTPNQDVHLIEVTGPLEAAPIVARVASDKAIELIARLNAA